MTPTTPQKEAGWRMLPPVSLPSAAGAIPAATAAAAPPEDPPGTRFNAHGLWQGPNALFSVLEPMAYSSMFSLPSSGIPAARSFSTTVALYGETKF